MTIHDLEKLAAKMLQSANELGPIIERCRATLAAMEKWESEGRQRAAEFQAGIDELRQLATSHERN